MIRVYNSRMPIQADQALFLRDNAIRTLRSEQPVTQRVIEAIPLDRGDYRPDPAAKSALELARHIVGAEHLFSLSVINGAFDFANASRGTDLKTSAEIAQWYAETTRQDIERLATVSAEALMKIIDFRGLFQLPAVAFLDFSMRHVVHHRGQLSTYLRPMGAKVPAIYGESYDSAQAKQAGV
jgi:uncharacterized damage-inducible protein DinB